MTQTSLAASHQVPGVYYQPRPRAQPRPLARTDVVGFIGFETRVRDGSTPSRLLLGPATPGHQFQVDVIGFRLPAGVLGPGRAMVPAHRDLLLSRSDSSLPMAKGGSITYSLVAILRADGDIELDVAAGLPSPVDRAAAVSGRDLERRAAGQPWVRIADVEMRLSADGSRVFPTVVPALPPSRCDDWSDFELQLGGLPVVDDGTLLARSVRMFFANGGGRCQVATIRRPLSDDPTDMARALADLVGLAGASEAEATGLEQLLRIFEVAIVDAPDLYARRVDREPRIVKLPPRDLATCFQSCDESIGFRIVSDATGSQPAGAPLFAAEDVREAQQAMLRRCAPDRWRVLLLLAAPVQRDGATGGYRTPDVRQALAWRQGFDRVVDDQAASCAAMYHPWALSQERLGSPIVEVPPTALAAGILARRDLARGPHVAPANERIVGVVGLSPPLGESDNGLIYAEPLNINPLRAFPGFGVQVWGARTLSADPWLRYLPVRRCLSAIERRALVALRPLVFEPITPTLWFQITQALLAILVPIFNAGALRGDTPEQAFYVRCDDSNNDAGSVNAGQVLCEVGVAIAAPTEFIVFRVGRREAIVEVLE
jgi:uncharacterized protein